MEHTKEPWAQHEDEPDAIVSVAAPHESLLTVDQNGIAKLWSESDARRIVACVNACKRFSTELLEAAAACGGIPAEPTDELIKCRKQRDELIADMQKIVAKCNLDMNHHDGAYPVRVYLLRDDMLETPNGWHNRRPTGRPR